MVFTRGDNNMSLHTYSQIQLLPLNSSFLQNIERCFVYTNSQIDSEQITVFLNVFPLLSVNSNILHDFKPFVKNFVKVHIQSDRYKRERDFLCPLSGTGIDPLSAILLCPPKG